MFETTNKHNPDHSTRSDAMTRISDKNTSAERDFACG